MLASLGIDSEARLKTLSKGTKEKVQLILVMSRQADLYILDEVIFMKNGSLILHASVDTIREKLGKSVDAYFREVYAC